MRAPKTYNAGKTVSNVAIDILSAISSLERNHWNLQTENYQRCKLTMIPGDDACIISGLNRATSEIILGLSARERGTFWYQGQGKLQIWWKKFKIQKKRSVFKPKALTNNCKNVQRHKWTISQLDQSTRQSLKQDKRNEITETKCSKIMKRNGIKCISN